MLSVDYLLENSGLPGPRGNLELLYRFMNEADAESCARCLSYIQEDTANSPQEFVGMCGIVAKAYSLKDSLPESLAFLKPYASHSSWRLREAVAIGIQELGTNRIAEMLTYLGPFIEGSAFEKRALVAGLCEPKLLKDSESNTKILGILAQVSESLAHDGKLSDAEKSLRKALAYGWSVVIAASPQAGKESFEALMTRPGQHLRWVCKENLKKNRLVHRDPAWVQQMQARLESL